MQMFAQAVNLLLRRRIGRLEAMRDRPMEAQQRVFARLMAQGRQTQFGKEFGLAGTTMPAQFAARVPVQPYEQLQPRIERVMRGERDVLWPGTVRWFAKSSGTTNGRSKFIPVTRESLIGTHYAGGQDMIAAYMAAQPASRMFAGKCLVLGGSHQINGLNNGSRYGDLSAVMLQNLPQWARLHRMPSLKTALMPNWEEKLERVVAEVLPENITNIAGVPTWTLVLMHRLLAKTGAKTIKEIWPNLELYTHGGVSFVPYRGQFDEVFGKGNVKYQETYNASEGFFGFQDDLSRPELLLMTDHGVYYEFIEAGNIATENPQVLPLEDVQAGRNYALVISTTGGLWRYLIGDTIKFTSTFPFRFQVSGRTRHFINAFGEELIIENAEQALRLACEATGAAVADFTAAPVYLQGKARGRHQWLIEFSVVPQSLEVFAELLDAGLRRINSDYDAKRTADIALTRLELVAMPAGSFSRWLAANGRLGGQNKVPRLANDRQYADELLKMNTHGSA